MMHDKNFTEELIIAGFGGQGIILAGKLLAQAVMTDGLAVSFMPAYGPEVRGGTSNCMVVISDQPVACPVIHRPDSVIVMNNASLRKFTPRLKPGGLLVINSSLADEAPGREDIEVVRVPADELAGKLNSPKSANMVVLGAYLSKKKLVTIDVVGPCLKAVLSSRYHAMIPLNVEALRAGEAHVRQKQVPTAGKSGQDRAVVRS